MAYPPQTRGPMMGPVKQPQPEAGHGYLGPHKNAFPTGFIRSKPNLNQIERATQGSVGVDVAKVRSGD